MLPILKRTGIKLTRFSINAVDDVFEVRHLELIVIKRPHDTCHCFPQGDSPSDGSAHGFDHCHIALGQVGTDLMEGYDVMNPQGR